MKMSNKLLTKYLLSGIYITYLMLPMIYILTILQYGINRHIIYLSYMTIILYISTIFFIIKYTKMVDYND